MWLLKRSGKTARMFFTALSLVFTLTNPSPPVPATPTIATVSIYHQSLSGRRTSSGERYNPEDTTAAHKELPLGSKVKLKNPETGQEADVRINDRGPHVKGREFDLSKRSAEKLGIPEAKGTAKVEALIIWTPRPG